MTEEANWSRSETRMERMERVLAARQPELILVVENVHDRHNIGAILRSCDAVGVMRIMMVYYIESPPEIAATSASGALKWLNFESYRSIKSCYDTLRKEGFQILATKIEPQAKSLYSYDLTVPTAIVMGNEHRGISQEAAAGADGLIYIPMRGMVESVNVSVAAAVSLFEAMRQRDAKGMYARRQLSEEILRSELQTWITK
ncbi:MAG: TrmH family RNA methyltransferase [Candidatus Kapaibacterium sp.]